MNATTRNKNKRRRGFIDSNPRQESDTPIQTMSILFLSVSVLASMLLSFMTGYFYKIYAHHYVQMMTHIVVYDLQSSSGNIRSPISLDRTVEPSLKADQYNDLGRTSMQLPTFMLTDLKDENESLAISELQATGTAACDSISDSDLCSVTTNNSENAGAHLFINERKKFAEVVVNMNFAVHSDVSLFRNPILKSTTNDDAFYEGFVHPAMITHYFTIDMTDAKNVGIISGSVSGFGLACANEVLKHSSVEQVIIFDENISSDTVLDSRLDFRSHRNWKELFITQFQSYPCDTRREKFHCDFCGHDADNVYSNGGGERIQKFDVLYGDPIDALSPNADLDFVGDISLMESMYSSLSENGLLVILLGKTPTRFSSTHVSNRVISLIEEVGFQSIHIYEEFNHAVGAPFSFLLACKSVQCRGAWFQNPSLMEISLQWKTIRDPITGGSSLKHFDGAVFHQYQTPPREWENDFCGRIPTPSECNLFLNTHNEAVVTVSRNNFHVDVSSIGEGAGRGLFATRDIPAGSFVSFEHMDQQVYFDQDSTYAIRNLSGKFPELSKVETYMDGYGLEQEHVAKSGYFVYSAPGLFINHGCEEDSNNVVIILQPSSRLDNDPHQSRELESGNSYYAIHRKPRVISSVYNPSLDRHMYSLMGTAVATKNINVGDELLIDYRWFNANSHDLEGYMENLHGECTGEAVGVITRGDKGEV